MSDYISREAALTALQDPELFNVSPRFLQILRDLPAADVEPVRRMAWKPLFESEITGWNPAFAGCDPIGAYVCSCCNSEATYTCNDEYELSNYCPNCGAKKMDLEGENDG